MINLGPTFIWTAVNLIVLYIVLRKILFRPVTQFMENRTKTIKDTIAEAERLKTEAMELKKKYEEQLKKAKQEAEAILDTARERGNREYDAIVSSAKKHANELVLRANEEIRREREQTIKEIKGQVAALALVAASKVIEANMDTETNRALVNKFIDEAGAA